MGMVFRRPGVAIDLNMSRDGIPIPAIKTVLRSTMRIFDAGVVNAIAANAPDQNGVIYDFFKPISDRRNIFLLDGGVAACIWSAPRVFECHLIFPLGCRGRAAVDASKRMGDYMMAYHADMLWGRPMESNRAALWHIRQAGFIEQSRNFDAVVGAGVVYFVRGKPCHL